MRLYCLFILIGLTLMGWMVSAQAEHTMPTPPSTYFPNIKASLDDGFFVLTEQQARGVLRANPRAAEEREAVLLLAHALWGQKRFSEILDLTTRYTDETGYTYWRARAFVELRQYEAALEVIQAAAPEEGNSYAPALLRLKGYSEQMTGGLVQAEVSFRRFANQFPQHADGVINQFDLANVLVSQGRLDAAVTIYETMVQGTNEQASQRARLKLAHVYYTHADQTFFDKARELFSGLATNELTRLAYRIDAYVELSALEEQSGKRAEAMDALQAAADLSPDVRQRVRLRLALVRMLLRDNDTTKALKLIEVCRAEAPNEEVAAELQLEKAGALLQSNLYEEASEAYQIYLDVAANPIGLAQAYLGKGLALWALSPDRSAEAAAAFDKAAKGLVDLPAYRATALFKAGDAYYRSGKYAEAEKRYRDFVTEFPRHADAPNALYQLGLALVSTEHPQDARKIFEELERKHADSGFAEKAALRVADLLLSTEQWEAALEKYVQIGQTYTNVAAVSLSLHQRGVTLYRLGRNTPALQAFETLLKDYPQSEYVPQATYMRGFCLYRIGQMEEAIATCNNFIRDYPDSLWTPEVVYWLAEQSYNQGKYGESESLFVRVANDFPHHKLAPRALYWSGRAAAAQANYLGAVERYSEVARRYTGNEVLPLTRFAQGDALTELGEFARAILAYDEIIKDYPESYLVNAAWGRKGDCQFSLASDQPARYADAINSYQTILDRPSASLSIKLQAEYKLGRCFEKNSDTDKAFSRYMNVVYTFINENASRSSDNVMWFTRSAFGAAGVQERKKEWIQAVQIYERVIEADVPAKGEAAKRIEKIRQDNWLLFQRTEEMNHVGINS